MNEKTKKEKGADEAREEKIKLLLEDVISLEDYAHDLFAFSPLPISFVSPVNVILEVNPSFEQLAGYDFSQLVGEPIEKIFEKRKIENLAQGVLKGEEVRAKEMLLFSKKKDPIPVQVFAKPRRNEEEEVVGYFLGAFDLSEIKKTEQELRQSQTALLNILEDTEEARKKAEQEREKTSAIIESLSDGILAFNREKRVALVNPKAEDIFELGQEEIRGESLSSVSAVEKINPLIEVIRERGLEKEFSRVELSLREDLIVEVSNIVIPKGKGELANIIIVHDVTREKVVERLKTEFVSISAHQLRTPLSAIKWSLKMLLDGDLGELEKEQKEFIEKTYWSNERMINLVNSLLNVTRIEEGRFIYKPEPVDLGKLAEEIIRTLKPTISKKNLNFSFKKDKNLPRLKLDREKMRIAVQNIIENAVKYTLEGGKVEIRVVKKEKEVEMRVKDTGVGIPKEQQERIFTKFFRGSNVVRLETVGTGLGLFIAQNIVRAHGGEMDFKSREGEGSTFWFTLPLETKV